MAEAGVVDVAALVANAEADAACLEQAVTATVEQEAAAMEEMQQRAEEHGINQKSAGVHGWAGSMMRKFERFLEKHGERLGYDPAMMEDPARGLPLVERFVDYCASGAGRNYFSPVGRVGLCDKYFSLHLPYTLAQRVFVMMQLPGWTGLRRAQVREKAEPYKSGLLEYWQKVQQSRDDATVEGASLAKEKWDDAMYYIAQDRWMTSAQLNLAVTTLSVMGFVRVTCSRSGAMARDWFDRKGLTPFWVGRNVLSVRCVARLLLERLERSVAHAQTVVCVAVWCAWQRFHVGQGLLHHRRAERARSGGTCSGD